MSGLSQDGWNVMFNGPGLAVAVGHLSLHSDDPGEDGSENEFEGGLPPYQRQTPPWATSTAAELELDSAVSFDVAGDQDVNYVGLWSDDDTTYYGSVLVDTETFGGVQSVYNLDTLDLIGAAGEPPAPPADPPIPGVELTQDGGGAWLEAADAAPLQLSTDFSARICIAWKYDSDVDFAETDGDPLTYGLLGKYAGYPPPDGFNPFVIGYGMSIEYASGPGRYKMVASQGHDLSGDTGSFDESDPWPYVLAATTPKSYRLDFDADDGSGNYVWKFYEREYFRTTVMDDLADDSDWTLISTVTVAGTVSALSSNNGAPLRLGIMYDANNQPFQGTIVGMVLKDESGTVVADPDCRQDEGTTTFSDTSGNDWEVHTTGTGTAEFHPVV